MTTSKEISGATAEALDISKVNRSMVARETGVDLAHVSRIFNLKATPSLYLACRISAALEISLDELCRGLQIDPGSGSETGS